jgi:hypothetical protein
MANSTMAQISQYIVFDTIRLFDAENIHLNAAAKMLVVSAPR